MMLEGQMIEAKISVIKIHCILNSELSDRLNKNIMERLSFDPCEIYQNRPLKNVQSFIVIHLLYF